ncbi:MAG: hypothetical protein IKU39_07765 [Lachnospiraceae bacterium]|nr:hypothetical protein [Lachnospiraceae bacterium]
MEELFVCAILCGLGFDKYNTYKEMLDRLLELNPTDEIVLDLYGRSYKDAILHLYSIMDEYTLDCELFGKCLMKELRTIYLSVEITEFGKKMYELWNRLPKTIDNMEKPFHILSYADDCLSYGDEKQCRELYESMFEFYE